MPVMKYAKNAIAIAVVCAVATFSFCAEVRADNSAPPVVDAEDGQKQPTTDSDRASLKRLINEKIDQGEYDEAIKLALKALQHDKTWADAAWLAGYAYQLKEDNKNSIEYYTLAAFLNPDMAEAYCNRGLCYEDFDRHDYAKNDFTRAIEISPKNDYAYASRAEVNYVLGLDEECIADARKAIELNPENAFAYAQLGASLARLGRFAEAVEAHKNTVSRDKSRPVYFTNLALALTQLGKYDEALVALAEANAVKPTADCYRQRAEVYMRMGQFEKALEDYSAALRLKTDDAHALAGRAVVNYLLGRKTAMVDDGRAAAKLLIADPHEYVALVMEDDVNGLSWDVRINYLRRALQTYEGKFDGRLFLLTGSEEMRANHHELAKANFELAKNYGFSSIGVGGNLK